MKPYQDPKNVLAKSKLDPPTIVAAYMASINTRFYRKIFAPYFLEALEACRPEDISILVQGTRPLNSETYRNIEKIGKTSKNIEAYICYVLATADINQLKIEELNGALNYLRKHHANKNNIIKSLKCTLTLLIIGREKENINEHYKAYYQGEKKWLPSDINESNALYIYFSPMLYGSGCDLLLHLTSQPNENKFYCNLSNLHASRIFFGNMPSVFNMENAELIDCRFRSSGDNIYFGNFSYSKLSNALFLFSDTNDLSLNLTGSVCSGKFCDFQVWYDKFIIDHKSLLSKPVAKYVKKAEMLFTRSSDRNEAFNPAKHIFINLPIEIQTPEALAIELTKYVDVQSKLADKYAKACEALKRILVVAVLDKLKAINEIGIDTKLLYEAAFNHACFASAGEKKPGFFEPNLTDSQKELKEGYEEICGIEFYSPGINLRS